jgi:hypothetical protein
VVPFDYICDMKGYYTEDILTLKEGKVVKLNRYWLCKDGDPKQAIYYNGTPQCNSNIKIPERLLKYTISNTGWNVGIVFVECAYTPPG